MLPGEKAVRILQMRTPGGKRAVPVKRSTLRTNRPFVVKMLLHADMNDTECGEVSVFRAERAIDDVDIVHEFWAQRLEPSEIALSVGLRGLILGNVVHQHFEAAIQAAVVQVETKTAKLE